MKLVFIVKDAANQRKKVAQAVNKIKISRVFSEVAVWPTQFAGHAVDLAYEACGQFDFLIAVGGDGTLNEVVNGCMQAKARGSQRDIPILGILPHGTANDFVKSLALKGSPEELVALVRNESHKKVDVGKIDYCGKNGQRESRYFINIADIGIGAKVVQAVNASHKLFGANLTFLIAIVKTFLTFKAYPMRVKSEQGFDWRGEALLLAVGNGRYYGSGLCIVPHGKMGNGLFGVTLMGAMSVLDFVLRFSELKKQQKINHAKVSYHEARVIEVQSESLRCAVEVDGEFLGHAPIRIEMLPAQLSMLMAV